MTIKNQKSNKLAELLDKRSKIILYLSIAIILFSFAAPIIFIQDTFSGIDFMDTGPIGDTIGGIMNPFIALGGILLTFLAFYIQVLANKQQKDSFRKELDEQKKQFKKSQFENQFYEMLNLHKDNVNELEINLIKFIKNRNESEKLDTIIKGRRVFEYMIKEIEVYYTLAKKCFPDKEYKTWFNEAYGVFFHGVNNEIKNKHDYFKKLYQLKTSHEGHNYKNFSNFVKSIFNIEWDVEFYYPVLIGYSSQLAHYYRHLFQTVKFISNQDEILINYEEKRNYLRILRAQLSNQEQAMIFYNWFSGFGKQWENDKNKFFTDYRMIHNIYQGLLLSDIQLEYIFELEGDYKKEKNREFDPLFEFQDW